MKGQLCLAFAVGLVDARIVLSRFPFYASLLATKEFRFSDLFFSPFSFVQWVERSPWTCG